MMSRPSGESEANTVTGSTSAGSLGERNRRSYLSVVFHIAETIVFIGKKVFCTGAGVRVCAFGKCLCLHRCVHWRAHASVYVCVWYMHVFALECALELTRMCVWRPELGARLIPLLLAILLLVAGSLTEPGVH